MKRHCLALDLKDDPKLIAEYEAIHQQIWPEIAKSIRDAGILDMQIYRLGNRLFMIMDVGDDFSFEEKTQKDRENPIVQEWEAKMWQYQQALPMAKEGEKWMLMDQIFSLNN